MQTTSLAAFVGLSLTLLCSSPAGTSEVPDTLVARDAGGKFRPATAKSWRTVGDAVVFELIEGADAAAIAAILSDSLATAKVSVDAGRLKIAGIPSDTLLNQLSSLRLGGDGGDPLAELGEVGGAVAMDTPEGGGSIRASKPTDLAATPRSIIAHDPKERVVAEVVKIERATFPAVTLTLKVRSSAKAGPLMKKLRRGRVLEAPVVLVTGGRGVDFAETNTQRNIGAYYLSRGDHVMIHAVADEGGKLELDFVERQTK